MEKLISLVIIGIVTVFGAAMAKWKAFKKSQMLTTESDIFELAKERTEV